MSPGGVVTFLSVYTPTFRRPFLLALNMTSVEQQTVEVEHIVVVDDEGIGVDGMFAAIPQHAHHVTGEYVMVLSDDNILTYSGFAADLRAEAEAAGLPDVVVFKGDIDGCVQPLVWRAEPEVTRIDLSCFAVHRDVWQAHAADWGHRYEGDFDFIHRLWECGYRFHWWDRLAFRALKISRGEAE